MFWQGYGDEGLAVLGVDVAWLGNQTEVQVRDWAEAMGVTFPIALDGDSERVYESYTRSVGIGEGSITFKALVDGDMTVRYLSWDVEQEELVGLVEALIAGG